MPPFLSIPIGLFIFTLGLISLVEDRRIHRWESRHVHSMLASQLYLWIGRLLDLALVGSGILLVLKGVLELLRS